VRGRRVAQAAADPQKVLFDRRKVVTDRRYVRIASP
jgi:hypothetical protein